MFYFLSMTTLKKEVKKGLLNKAYSEDEAREIYKEYLKLKQDRMVGFKQAGKTIISTFILLTILSLFNLKKMGIWVMLLSLLLISLISLLIFLVAYYMMFGRFQQQINEAMKPHYSHILNEMNRK